MATRKSPARGASKPASNRQVPGWVWLFTGVVAGLFIAFLYHLAELRFNPDRPLAAKPEKPAAESKPATDSSPRFDFYAVLPKMEVIVPKGDDAESGDSNSSTKPQENRNHAGEQYLLQAGSFRAAADADRRRAELILQGYNVNVQAVELSSGDTWHRVMIGPFDNINALHRAQDKMAAVGVETLPIKVKKEG